MNYKVQEHLKPKALSGISNDQISQHWKLYEGYVENANRLIEGVARAEAGSSRWAELKRRLGFEVDGVVLEHAYLVGFGAAGAEYVAAFRENIDWEVVEQRYRESKAGRFTARF
jgi:superoxide dismutase